MYGPYYESLAAVPNRELSNYLPGRDAAKDAEPIKTPVATHEGFLWDKAEFSFEDVLDLINPLQHLPLISTMYRESTGDTIGAVPRVLGGALYGLGPIGAAIGAGTALVNVAMEAMTGKDVGGTMMALLNGDEADGTALAERTAGTSSAVGGKPDNATAADADMPLTPAEELRTFPGVNLRPADAKKANDKDAPTAPDKTAGDKTTAPTGQPAPHGFGGALGGAAPATPQRKADAANGWVTQSITSGLDKYRTMAREQDKKPAGLDAVY
jgi:hypothetical protein